MSRARRVTENCQPTDRKWLWLRFEWVIIERIHWSEKMLKSDVLACQKQNWYPKFKKFCIRTEFLECTKVNMPLLTIILTCIQGSSWLFDFGPDHTTAKWCWWFQGTKTWFIWSNQLRWRMVWLVRRWRIGKPIRSYSSLPRVWSTYSKNYYGNEKACCTKIKLELPLRCKMANARQYRKDRI